MKTFPMITISRQHGTSGRKISELLAKKLGFDPAVMASPIITTIVDFLSLLVYFAFATAMLGIG